MRSCVRFSFLALLVGVIVAVSAPAAQAAFGVESFFAANCKAGFENCKKAASPAEEKEKAEEEGFTQAGGHPNFGVTDFRVNTHVIQTVPFEAVAPDGIVDHVRTDVAPGVSTNPEAVAKCSAEEFGDKELAPGTGAFPEPKCPAGSIIGVNKVVVLVEAAKGVFANVELEGTVYNLEQPTGLASEFGVALSLAPLSKPGVFAHTLIEGHVEWASDYHDYFEIKVSPEIPLISSRLVFKGNIGTGLAPIGSGGFLTNPTSCTGAGPQTTSSLHLESEEGGSAASTYTTPIGSDNCGALPFAPTFSLTPETTKLDTPTGVTTELALPHDLSPTGLDSSQLKTATVILPEGMTLNPAAAAGLGTQACTPAQARINSTTPGVACPEASKIGTVTLQVPGLPANSLLGDLYLGTPNADGTITDPPFTVYVDAESARYGLSVRLKGLVTPDPVTGRVTASFTENPEQPFSNLVLKFKGGDLAPIANPLSCGTASTLTAFAPFSGTATQTGTIGFDVGNGSGGACPSPLPFSLGQSTVNQSPNAGGHTNFTFSLDRADGHQYLQKVKTTLPAGLSAAIPAVALCSEANAIANTCPDASKIGVAVAQAGAGPSPFQFTGQVYLTGPYQGAPYGMSIVVPATAGPFNLGPVTTRATINIDPSTARVTVESVLPTIFKGIPLRLRKVTVSINKQEYLFNPTNCSPSATESTLTSTFGAIQNVSTPFQVANCGSLKFKPTFKASTSAKTSKANGASLTTTITQAAGEGNIKSVKVQLPKALPSRLTTLQKACTEATFASNPLHCPSGSFVGGATVVTPTLPGKMTGPAILVSHGGAAFPDLDLVLEGNGVKVILVGNTDIKKGITTTTFASTPDVPVSSVTVSLPVGSHSALAANTNLCANPLTMPTTIVGQNGATIKQNTKIAVSNCGVRIVGKKVAGNTAFLTVQTFAPGRISGSGSNLKTVYRRLNKAQKTASLQVPLSNKGRGKHRPFKVKVRVGFVPKKNAPSSVAFTTVKF
jgi:hypothetical protein